MNRSTLPLLFAFLFALPLPAATPDSHELAEARARLLEAYQNGQTDSSPNVKNLREKIAALEYIAANSPTTPRATSPRLVNITFPGGPMSAFIAAAEKGGHDGFNIVAEKEDLKLELPPFTIRNADPTALAAALDKLLVPRGYMLEAMGRMQAGQAPVFVLQKGSRFRRDSRFYSFQLAGYLEHQTVDDIIGAIRVAWELDPTHVPEQMQVKFHPSTSILLVSGPQDAIQIADGVIRQLRKSDEAKSPPGLRP